MKIDWRKFWGPLADDSWWLLALALLVKPGLFIIIILVAAWSIFW